VKGWGQFGAEWWGLFAGNFQLDSERVIGAFEAIKLLRDSEPSGEATVSYSKWVVVKDIPFVSVVSHKKFLEKNSYLEELHTAYQGFLNQCSPEVINNSNVAMDFFADEFAKDFTPNDYDYLLSALFTEMIVSKGFAAGVLYPSVRTGGQGFNVAIHPSFIDNNHLELEAVAECTLYKRGKRTMVDNETVAMVLKGQDSFELKPVLPEYHVGRERILKELEKE
jgi:hypothetical protein